jgi:arylsulfatase A-like enzyme
LIFFFLPTFCLQAAGEKPSRPNIILILADDVSADELSPYGGAISMPNLQKLADEGVLFRNTWATPVCAPSRAMLMTGKYPHHTGYYENPVAPEVPFWKDPCHLPVLKMMKEAGYTTSMVGKIHPGDDSDVGLLGAEDWMITWFWTGHDGPRQNHWSPQLQDMYGVSWYWHPGLVQNGKGVPTTSKDFGPDLELKHLLEFTAADRDKPFLAYWATNLPHKAHEEVAGLPEGRWYYTDVPALDKKGRQPEARFTARSRRICNTSIICWGVSAKAWPGRGGQRTPSFSFPPTTGRQTSAAITRSWTRTVTIATTASVYP